MAPRSSFLPALVLCCAELFGCATSKRAQPATQDAAAQEAREQEVRLQAMREELARDQEEEQRRQRTEDFVNRSDRRR